MEKKVLMEELTPYIQANLAYAPFIIFGLLLLAGLSLPISEDALLFISALLASQYPERVVPLFLGVYLGAFASDLIAYALGRFLGPRLWEIRLFRQMVSLKRVDQLAVFYQKNGLLTIVLGRFIPFGVRNALFVTAGLSKMRCDKFAVFDFIAVSISCSFYFYLYYSYGQDVIAYVWRGNIILFSVFIAVVVSYLCRKWLKRKRKRNSTMDIPA